MRAQSYVLEGAGGRIVLLGGLVPEWGGQVWFRSNLHLILIVRCRRVRQSCSEPEVGSRTRVLLQGYGVQESAKVR